MTVTLTPKETELVNRQIQSGGYRDAHEVIPHALVQLVEGEIPGRPRDFDPNEDSPELEAMLLESVNSPAKPWDPKELDEFFRELERKNPRK